MNDDVPGLGVCVSQYLNSSTTFCSLDSFFFPPDLGQSISPNIIKLLQDAQHTQVSDTCHNGQNTLSISIEIRNTTTAQTNCFSIILLSYSEVGSRSNLTRKAWFCEISSQKSAVLRGVRALSYIF